MRRLLTSLFAVAVGGLVTTDLAAQTATDQFLVSITVVADCTIAVDDLEFGEVTDLTTPVTSTTTGTVT